MSIAAICLLALPGSLHAKLLAIEERGGLDRAYVFRDRSPDLVEAYLLIKSGAFDEGDAPGGLAHYLEHLVWMNAVGPDGRGSTARDDNAQVTGGLTLYWMKGKPEKLDSYLETLAKVFEPPSLDERFMLEERDIVMREYDYRVAEQPLRPIVRDLVAQLFGDAPRGRSLIGTRESIAKFTPEEALALHARTHVPANAALLIIGNTDYETAAPLVEKHFGGIAAGTPPPRRGPPPFQARRKIVETSVEGSAYQQLIYFKRIRLETAVPEDRLQLRLDLLHAMLDSTLEGSLAKPLRFDDFIARRYSLDLSAIEPGEVLMTFTASPDEGVDLELLLEAFEDTLDRIADEGIPEATFERIRKKRISGLEASKGKRGRAIHLVIDQIGNDAEPINPKTYIRRYRQTTLDDLDGLIEALADAGDVAAALISPDRSN